jgi:Cap4 dsDNA endonuclease
MQDLRKSIHSLLPFESGGRSARQGFAYQDHIGASFCIDLLGNTTINEIWFENLDDLTLIHNKNDSTIVEFVQVKATHPTSRWSFANLTFKDSGSGQSIFEKSFNQCRCVEPIKIRIVTCYDVNDELNILTHYLDSPIRLNKTDKINILEKQFIKKFGESFCSPNGLTIREWIDCCYWDKRPDSVEALESSNKIALETSLKAKNIVLQPEYRNELYEQILNQVMGASTTDIKKYPNCFRLTKDGFQKWLDERIADFQFKNRGLNALESKMIDAGFDNEEIETAKELRWAYRETSFNNDFCEPSDLKLMENEILARVQSLKTQRYKNAITLDGVSFHNLCLENIDDVLQSNRLRTKDIPEHLGYGYLYEITDRCLIRFVKK